MEFLMRLYFLVLEVKGLVGIYWCYSMVMAEVMDHAQLLVVQWADSMRSTPMAASGCTLPQYTV